MNQAYCWLFQVYRQQLKFLLSKTENLVSKVSNLEFTSTWKDVNLESTLRMFVSSWRILPLISFNLESVYIWKIWTSFWREETLFSREETFLSRLLRWELVRHSDKDIWSWSALVLLSILSAIANICCPRPDMVDCRVVSQLAGRGRHWNFVPLQCLRPRPEILDRYISLSCLRWLPTACHERLAYFHCPQWVTWLVTWWVTWSRWPDAGRHIGKCSLWTTLLRFSRSAQISLFSNFTKLGQLFFDNIFFGLTS